MRLRDNCSFCTHAFAMVEATIEGAGEQTPAAARTDYYRRSPARVLRLWAKYLIIGAIGREDRQPVRKRGRDNRAQLRPQAVGPAATYRRRHDTPGLRVGQRGGTRACPAA